MCRRTSVAAALCAVVLLSALSSAALADERCGQLLALNRQYAGVRLTDEQKQIKIQLIAWYKANCGSIRSVRRSTAGVSHY